MAAYVCLIVAAAVVGQSAYFAGKTPGPDLIPAVAFLCWRVSRGGRVSRGILIWVSTGMLLDAAGLGGQWWHLQPAAVSALGLAGLLLLLSPAVYVRTHPGTVAASSAMRLIPSRWLILGALPAGPAVAGLTLAITHRWFLLRNGCADGPVQGMPQHCVGVGRGFPEAVVATVHGITPSVIWHSSRTASSGLC